MKYKVTSIGTRNARKVYETSSFDRFRNHINAISFKGLRQVRVKVVYDDGTDNEAYCQTKDTLIKTAIAFTDYDLV